MIYLLCYPESLRWLSSKYDLKEGNLVLGKMKRKMASLKVGIVDLMG